VVLVFFPGGITGALQRLWNRRRGPRSAPTSTSDGESPSPGEEAPMGTVSADEHEGERA
jgi:hypothetical protein